MLERVLTTIARHSMFERRDRVGVAVSGGADSVGLLHVLMEVRDRWDLDLVVLHLDHQLRGAESRADVEFVRSLAHRHGLDFVTERASVAPTSSENLEQWAREARRDFFRRAIADRLVDCVATGHTTSDQAETVIFRVLRGAGTAGMAGILPVTAEGLVRPLLGVTRAEVIDYLHQRGLYQWCTDSSNQDRHFSRNRIRLELIPLLKRDYNPAVEEQLARSAEIARAEEQFWQTETQRVAEAGFTRRGGAILFRGTWLRSLPLALARRVVRLAIWGIKEDLLQIEFDHVEQILDLTGQTEGHGRRQIPGVDIFRSFDWIRLARLGENAQQPRLVSSPLTVPGTTLLGPIRLQTEVVQGTPSEWGYNEGGTSAGSMLDLDRVTGPLQLRYWLPGDQYQPVGAQTAEKLKEMFQSARIPIWERRFWPIVECGSDIVWSRQFGAALGFQAAPASRRVLKLREVEAGI